MASGATFHAKITADAREFIAQVEGAAEALKALVQTSTETTRSMGRGGAGRAQTAKAKADVRDVYDEAIAKGQQAHREAMQQIAAENTARARERQIASSTVRDLNRFRDLERQAQIRGNMAPGPYRQGDAGIRDIQVLQEVQRRGNRQILAEQRKEAQLVRQEKSKQAAHEREIANLNRQQLDAMVTGRYALYDMANAYQQIATNAFRIVQGAGAAVQTAAQFESAFTAVERAVGLEQGSEAFRVMRNALVDLSTRIPVAFAEIAEIATLGAQMGVAAGDIENFTRVISSFASITGTTVDATAESFGRLSALAKVPVSEFENLASAVLVAGFNAVATEEEILSMSQSIAGAAANAGYSADQIVGLATALSSLGIAPEQARGVILRLFGEITRAIEGGSDKLEEFAAASGMAAEEAQYLWKESPEEFFTSLLSGLSTVENLTTALDALGITNTREINVLQRLTGNMDIYAQSLNEASTAYAEGTGLATIYSATADNLETKIVQLQNAFAALQDAAGSATAEAIKPVVDILIDAARAATEFAKTDIGKFILPAVAAVAGLTAAFAGIRFVGSLATAQLLAMRTAILKMGQIGSGAQNVFTGLINAIRGNIYVTDQLSGRTQFLTRQQIEAAMAGGVLDRQVGNNILSMNRATTATRALSASLSILGAAMAAVTVVGVVATIVQMNKLNDQIGQNVGGAEALARAIAQDTEAYRNGQAAIATHTVEVAANGDAQRKNADASTLVIDAQGRIAQQFRDTTGEITTQTAAIGENFKQLLLQDISQSDAFKNLFENLQNQGTEINTLLDAMEINISDFVEAAAADPEAGAFDVLTKGLETAVVNIDKFDEKTQVLIRDLQRVASANEGLQFGDFQAFIMGLGGNVEDLSRLITGAELGIANSSVYIAQDLGKIAKAAQDGVAGALEYYEVLQALGLGMESVLPPLTDVGDEFEKTEEKANGLSRALRTVIDYANDLSGIFERVIDLEFGEQISLDAITTGWKGIADSAAKAEEAVKNANAEIKDLTADKAVLEYQLSVAERYGDELRAAQLRAKLAEVNSKITDSEKELAEAQERSQMSLSGNSEAAIENRAAILGIVDDYQNYIESLAKAGKSSSEIRKEIRTLKNDFRTQARSLGFSSNEIEKYASLFDEFGTVVDKAPRNVDIEVALGLTAAEQAIAEFLAKDRSMGVGVDLETKDAEKTWEERKAELEKKHPKLFLDVTPAELELIDLDKDIDDLLDEERVMKSPRIDGINAAKGNTETQKWLNKYRELKKPNVKDITADAAERKLTDWLNKVRTMTIGLDFDSKQMVRSHANAAQSIYKEFTPGTLLYESYREMYLILNRIANGMTSTTTSGGRYMQYSQGGLVTGPGTGTSDTIPAMLSNGEFVVKAASVKHYGADFMNALNKQRVAFSTPASSMLSGGFAGPQITQLAPEDRALLRAVANRPVTLYADNTKIAQSANMGNETLNQRGLK